MRFNFALAALATMLIGTVPATAQDDLSVEEVLGVWQKQKEVFHEAGSNGLGRTRGLTLITVEGAAVAETAPQGAVSVTADAVAPAAGDAAGDTAVAATGGVATGGVATGGGAQPMDPNKPLVASAEAAAGTGAGTGGAAAPLVFGQLDPELQVNLQVRFGFDSAALSDDQKPRLDKICEAMKLSDVKLFRIIGHTDTAGSDTYNQRLSVLRAKEVARYLVEDCGIAAPRLETLGLGERFLLNQNDPRADENRRVEFQALS